MYTLFLLLHLCPLTHFLSSCLSLFPSSHTSSFPLSLMTSIWLSFFSSFIIALNNLVPHLHWCGVLDVMVEHCYCSLSFQSSETNILWLSCKQLFNGKHCPSLFHVTDMAQSYLRFWLLMSLKEECLEFLQKHS